MKSFLSQEAKPAVEETDCFSEKTEDLLRNLRIQREQEEQSNGIMVFDDQLTPPYIKQQLTDLIARKNEIEEKSAKFSSEKQRFLYAVQTGLWNLYEEINKLRYIPIFSGEELIIDKQVMPNQASETFKALVNLIQDFLDTHGCLQSVKYDRLFNSVHIKILSNDEKYRSWLRGAINYYFKLINVNKADLSYYFNEIHNDEDNQRLQIKDDVESGMLDISFNYNECDSFNRLLEFIDIWFAEQDSPVDEEEIDESEPEVLVIHKEKVSNPVSSPAFFASESSQSSKDEEQEDLFAGESSQPSKDEKQEDLVVLSKTIAK